MFPGNINRETRSGQAGNPALDSTTPLREGTLPAPLATVRELLLSEESPSAICHELAALAALAPSPLDGGVVAATLLKHPDKDIRAQGYSLAADLLHQGHATEHLLFISAGSETEPDLATRAHQLLREARPGRSSALCEVHGKLRFSTRYAKEQNMLGSHRDTAPDSQAFDWTLVSALDPDPLVRSAGVRVLAEMLPHCSPDQRFAATLHVAFGLRSMAPDGSSPSFQAYLLSCASTLRESSDQLLPLVLQQCENPDANVRVDAALTTLFLSRSREDFVTDVIVNCLKQNSQSEPRSVLEAASEKPVQRSALESNMRIDFEYQWVRFGIAEFLRRHYNIDIDLSEEMQQVYREVDSVQQRFADELNQIVDSFRERMEEHERKTRSILDDYRRSSLVTMSGLSLRLLGEENQSRLSNELVRILIDPAESEKVKERVLDVLPRIEANHDAFVGPLLQAGILAAHLEYPSLRAASFRTLGQLRIDSEQARATAILGLQRFGVQDACSTVQLAAREALEQIAGSDNPDPHTI